MLLRIVKVQAINNECPVYVSEDQYNSASDGIPVN